jgi:hypothetical protein
MAVWERLFCKRNDQGASVLEFALVAPLLFLFVFSLLELGLILTIRNALETGVTAGSRYGTIWNNQDSVSRQSMIEEIIRSKTMGFIQSNNIVVSISHYENFGGVSGTDPNEMSEINEGAPGIGNYGDVVIVRAQYDYHVLTPLVATVFGAQMQLSALSLMKNEVHGDTSQEEDDDD